MLTEIYIAALLVDEEMADQVWSTSTRTKTRRPLRKQVYGGT